MTAEQHQSEAIAGAIVREETNPKPRKVIDVTTTPPTEREIVSQHGFSTKALRHPPSLMKITIDPSLSEADRIQKYGKWDVEMIRDAVLAPGVYGQAGNVYKVIGDVAFTLVEQGQARYCDKKLEEENRILDEADKIRKTNPRRLDPERYTPPTKKPSWMGGLLQPTPGNA